MLSDVNHRGVYERPVRPSEARAYTSASVCNLYTHLTKTSVAATNDVLEAGQNQTQTAAVNTSTLTHSYRSSCDAVSCLKYALIEQALGGAGGRTENAYCILCKIHRVRGKKMPAEENPETRTKMKARVLPAQTDAAQCKLLTWFEKPERFPQDQRINDDGCHISHPMRVDR